MYYLFLLSFNTKGLLRYKFLEKSSIYFDSLPIFDFRSNLPDQGRQPRLDRRQGGLGKEISPRTALRIGRCIKNLVVKKKKGPDPGRSWSMRIRWAVLGILKMGWDLRLAQGYTINDKQ